MPPQEMALGATAATAATAATLAAEQLASRVIDGESGAFRELFETYHGLVFRLGARLLGNADEAAELAQEVFLVVHRRIHTLRNGQSLKSWICRITVTRSYNRLRQQRRRHSYAHVSLDRTEATHRPLALRAREPDPEDHLLRKQQLEAVADALKTIPFTFRTTLVMRDVEGMTYEEIASALGISLGTVKSRIARGRAALRRALNKEEVR